MKPVLAIVLLFLAACSPSEQPVVNVTTDDAGVTADTVYTNGKIYTVNPDQPWAEALAIKDGKFMVVGSAADVEAVTGAGTDVVDLEGAFAMPGIQDAHLHPSTGGANIDAAVGGFVFSEDMTREEIQAALLEYADANPGDGWIKGMKWGAGSFPPDGKPRKDLIDEVITDRPVFLLDETNHNAVVNSKGLEIAGITADTPQPQGGVIEKDPETGEPTGFLAEWAMFPVTSLLPRPTLEQVRLAIEMSLEDIDSYGIVAIKDVSASGESYAAYKALDDEGKLNYRVDVAIIMAGALNEEPNAFEVIADRGQYRSRLVDPDNVKYVADGTPLSGTSIFLEPYANDPDSYGMWLMRDQDIKAIPGLIADDINVTVHSIGDGSTRQIIDIIEKARAEYPESTRPVQIAHPMFVNPDDMKRMKDLNIIAEVSPTMHWWTPITKLLIDVLGEERANQTLPVADFLRAGVHVAYGSDWPAGTATANPWRILEGVMTRQNPEGDYPGELLGEPISLADTIKIFTLNGAIAMEHADITGSIEVGKYADMVVLNQNLFDLVEEDRADEISETLVERTLFEGRVVFDREAAVDALDVVDIQVTNAELKSAVDAADLNLLFETDIAQLWGGGAHAHWGEDYVDIEAGNAEAPPAINASFSALLEQGYQFARPGRAIYWQQTDENYWIQWAIKDQVASLWAYDPEAEQVVEILQVKEN